MVQIHSDYPASGELELGHPSDDPLSLNLLPSDDVIPSVTVEDLPDDFSIMVMVDVMNGNTEGLKSHIDDPRFSPERTSIVNSKPMTYIELVIEQRFHRLPCLTSSEILLEMCELFLEGGVKPTQASLRMAILYGDMVLFDLLVQNGAILHGHALIDAYVMWIVSKKRVYQDIFDMILSNGVEVPEELELVLHNPPDDVSISNFIQSLHQ